MSTYSGSPTWSRYELNLARQPLISTQSASATGIVKPILPLPPRPNSAGSVRVPPSPLPRFRQLSQSSITSLPVQILKPPSVSSSMPNTPNTLNFPLPQQQHHTHSHTTHDFYDSFSTKAMSARMNDLRQPHRPAPPPPPTTPPAMPKQERAMSLPTPVAQPKSVPTTPRRTIRLSSSLTLPPPPPPRNSWQQYKRLSNEKRMDPLMEVGEYEDILDIVDAYGSNSSSGDGGNSDTDEPHHQPTMLPHIPMVPTARSLSAPLPVRAGSASSSGVSFTSTPRQSLTSVDGIKSNFAEDTTLFMSTDDELISPLDVDHLVSISWPMPGVPLPEKPTSPPPYDSSVDVSLLQSLDKEMHAFNVRASLVADTSGSDRSSKSISEPSEEILDHLFHQLAIDQQKALVLNRAKRMSKSVSTGVNGQIKGHKDEHNEQEEDDEDLENLSERRLTSLKEMLNTERSYVRGLKRLCESFLYPLRSASKQRQGLLTNVRQSFFSVRGTLKRDRQTSLPLITVGRPVDAVQTRANVVINNVDLNLIFGNIETILSAHKRAQRMMEDRHRDWNNKVCLSDIYKHLLTSMSQYQVYVENFTHACSTLQRLTDQSKDFRRFIKQQDENSLDSMNLKAYLGLPLRRIGRYFNYLSQQVALTPASHPDHKNMTRLLKDFSRASEMIAASVATTESRLRLHDLEKTIVGLPRWTNGKHQLIYAGKLQQFTMTDDNPDLCEYFVMLLDDRIVWSRETGSDRYVYKGQVMLLEAFVTDLADTSFYTHASVL
ncbi:hypothetical protein BDF19DRAFT_422143 [Syncephalis fuscata]|nr:hypothetical protein BDF19DRAFT_422143 [Syncephalis fuscata]